jgi:hypothetical protein
MRFLRLAALAAFLAVCAAAQTTVADTLYLQGDLWNGQINLSWPAYTTADGHQVAAGSKLVTVTDGAVLASSLWPTVGATPSVSMMAVYITSGGDDRGKRWIERWNVPASPSTATLADVHKTSSLSGNSVRSGTVAPSNSIGIDGDFYLRIDTSCLYGPKASNAWPGTCVSLVGPTGLTGPPGPTPSGTPNKVLATDPSGSATNPAALRALVSADIPSLSALYLSLHGKADAAGAADTATALASLPTKCPAGQYPLGVDVGGNAANCTIALTLPSVTTLLAGNGSGGASDSGKAAPSGAIVGTTDAQVVTDKTLGRTETAGAGGVTANLLAAKDTSTPTTKYVLPSAGGCGSGVAAATASSGASFILYASAGQSVVGVADGTITAGHLVTGGSSTPGRVADIGQSARSSVPSSTCIVGVAKASATAGQTVAIVYDGPGSFGAGTWSDDGTTASTTRNLAIGPAVLPSGAPTGSLAASCVYSAKQGFNVACFGALSDGSHDDAPNIQAALTAANALGGGLVIVPPGTTMIGATLNIFSYTTLRLEQGATIKLKNNSNVYMLSNNHAGISDVVIQGGTWDQNGANQTQTPPGWMGQSIWLWNCTRCTIRDLSMLNALKFSIHVSGATDLLVEHIYFSTFSDGVDGSGPWTRFTLRDLSGTTGDNMVGLGITSLAATPAYADFFTTTGSYSDGLIENVRGVSGHAFVRLTGITGYAFSRIKIKDVSGTVTVGNAVEPGFDDGIGPIVGADYYDISTEGVTATPSAGYASVSIAATNWHRGSVRRVMSPHDGPAVAVLSGITGISHLLIDGVETASQALSSGSVVQIASPITVLETNNVRIATPSKVSGTAAFGITAAIGSWVGSNVNLLHLYYGITSTVAVRANISNWQQEDAYAVLHTASATAVNNNFNFANMSLKSLDQAFSLYGPTQLRISNLDIDTVPIMVLSAASTTSGALAVEGFRYTGTFTLVYTSAGTFSVNIAPQWYKATKTYADFSNGALNMDITGFTLPYGGIIHATKIKHRTAFGGGVIASYTLSIGILGTDVAKYAPACDVFRVVSTGPAGMCLASLIGSEFGGGETAGVTNIDFHATSTGQNLNGATAGVADFYLLISFAK